MNINTIPELNDDEKFILNQLIKDPETTNPELGSMLYLSIGTIRNRFADIYEKFGVPGYGKRKRGVLIDFIKSVKEAKGDDFLF